MKIVLDCYDTFWDKIFNQQSEPFVFSAMRMQSQCLLVLLTADGKDSEATLKKYKEIHLMILLNEVFKLKNNGNENFMAREMQKLFQL